MCALQRGIVLLARVLSFVVVCICFHFALDEYKFFYVFILLLIFVYYQCNYHFLFRNNIPFLRLDGTLNQQQREKVLKQFSEDNNIMVSDSSFLKDFFSLVDGLN